MSISCECCVLSGRGVCDESITRPESPTECGVCEASTVRRPWPTRGCLRHGKQIVDFRKRSFTVQVRCFVL
jgi:hypothetical protein